MKKLLTVLIVQLVLLSAQAAVVDTVWVESKTMKQSYRCVVITPSVSDSAPHKISGHLFAAWIQWLVCQLDHSGTLSSAIRRSISHDHCLPRGKE